MYYRVELIMQAKTSRGFSITTGLEPNDSTRTLPTRSAQQDRLVALTGSISLLDV